jgi:hypothetical protein
LLTKQDLEQCAADMAAEFKAMSYAQLEELYQRRRPGSDEPVLYRNWRGTSVSMDVTLAKFGRLRPRISVEIIVAEDTPTSGPTQARTYFERFASGQLSDTSRTWDRLIVVLMFLLGTVTVLRLLYWLGRVVWKAIR